jgi:agmatinase
MTFLAARGPGDGAPARVTLLGVPYDATASFRRGSRFGPDAIRRASDSIETYSPTLHRDLADASLVDGGDLDLERLEPDAMVQAIRRQIPPGVPFFLGGEHTITLGAVRGITPRFPEVVVLQWDAHTDLRDVYDDRRTAHATVMRRILDGGVPLVQLGIRGGTRDEFTLARERCLHSSRSVAVPPALLERLRTVPLYLSVDIDVLDPAVAPGTGNPEPDGASYAELFAALRDLAGCQIVGMDVVEVAPALDPSGRTAVVAASLIREMVLLFGR